MTANHGSDSVNDADDVTARPARPPRSSRADVIDLNAAWAAQQGVEPHVVQPYRPLPGWLRAAVILAFLLAASLLLPPVRAWIAGVLAPGFGGRDASSSVEPGSRLPSPVAAHQSNRFPGHARQSAVLPTRG